MVSRAVVFVPILLITDSGNLESSITEVQVTRNKLLLVYRESLKQTFCLRGIHS